MENFLTPSNITFILGILAIIFSVFNYFKNPQTNIEKNQIKADEELKDKATILSQKEVENKANVLEKQFQWYMDTNEKKFSDFSKRLEDAFLLASNHTHTVDVKVDMLTKESNDWHLKISNQMTDISRIIEERIPKKQ